MTPRDERQADWILVGFMAAVIGLLAWAHETDPPVPDVQESVAPERGVDYQRVAQRNGRRFAECHADLVRAQDRLRRLGHRWSDEAHGWVRVR